MNQKYASDCALCILFCSEIQFIGKMSPINIIIMPHLPPAVLATFMLQNKAAIIYWTLLKLCSKNAKAAVLLSWSHQMFQKDLIINTIFFSTFIQFWPFSSYSQDGHLPLSFPNGVFYRLWEAESPNFCYEHSLNSRYIYEYKMN